MNKNPKRPEDIDNIISECLTTTTQEEPQHKKAEREIIKEVFGE